MTRNKKIIITMAIATVIAVFAWAPWLDNQSLHDKIFEERAEIDGTIDKYTGEPICDYNIAWAPFGRWAASCEGGYYVTFWGKILYPEPVAVGNPCMVCINGCDTCPEGCEECLIDIEKKIKNPNLKWYYNPEDYSALNAVEIPKFADNEPETIIDSLSLFLSDSSLRIDFSKPKNYSQWWISDDGWSIIDDNAVAITSLTGTRDGQMWPEIGAEAKRLNRLLTGVFSANDFSLNGTNISKSGAENEFYDFVVAFQKGETRCVLLTNGDDGTYEISCSDRFQEAYNQQIDYLKCLNVPVAVVSVKERIGSFVWLSVHFRRTGYLALIKEGPGAMPNFKLIFTGQEAPPCSLMTENSVPKEVYYGVCYDNAGNIIVSPIFVIRRDPEGTESGFVQEDKVVSGPLDKISVTFNRDIDITTLTKENFYALQGIEEKVLATIEYDKNTRTASLVFSKQIEGGGHGQETRITIIVEGIKDMEGNEIEKLLYNIDIVSI